ncbi:predicted protein [Histoplasma capsulatum H143]|uniref:Uncharacterized protein n=1 Tax=Ajellomyces capsulatus (strain H143) TaxID=544712 RepID=C6H4Z7_AJECH|nr:predicted protein [Histoplasma capsulatum H143]
MPAAMSKGVCCLPLSSLPAPSLAPSRECRRYLTSPRSPLRRRVSRSAATGSRRGTTASERCWYLWMYLYLVLFLLEERNLLTVVGHDVTSTSSSRNRTVRFPAIAGAQTGPGKPWVGWVVSRGKLGGARLAARQRVFRESCGSGESAEMAGR